MHIEELKFKYRMHRITPCQNPINSLFYLKGNQIVMEKNGSKFGRFISKPNNLQFLWIIVIVLFLVVVGIFMLLKPN